MKYKLIFVRKGGPYDEFIRTIATDDDIMSFIDAEARKIADRLNKTPFSERDPDTFDIDLFRCDIISGGG